VHWDVHKYERVLEYWQMAKQGWAKIMKKVFWQSIKANVKAGRICAGMCTSTQDARVKFVKLKSLWIF